VRWPRSCCGCGRSTPRSFSCSRSTSFSSRRSSASGISGIRTSRNPASRDLRPTSIRASPRAMRAGHARGSPPSRRPRTRKISLARNGPSSVRSSISGHWNPCSAPGKMTRPSFPQPPSSTHGKRSMRPRPCSPIPDTPRGYATTGARTTSTRRTRSTACCSWGDSPPMPGLRTTRVICRSSATRSSPWRRTSTARPPAFWRTIPASATPGMCSRPSPAFARRTPSSAWITPRLSHGPRAPSPEHAWTRTACPPMRPRPARANRSDLPADAATVTSVSLRPPSGPRWLPPGMRVTRNTSGRFAGVPRGLASSRRISRIASGTWMSIPDRSWRRPASGRGLHPLRPHPPTRGGRAHSHGRQHPALRLGGPGLPVRPRGPGGRRGGAGPATAAAKTTPGVALSETADRGVDPFRTRRVRASRRRPALSRFGRSAPGPAPPPYPRDRALTTYEGIRDRGATNPGGACSPPSRSAASQSHSQ